MQHLWVGCRSARERLERAERIDPVGHALHVAAALAWGFAQSTSNAAEGITWGLLLAVTVLRLPKVLRCWTAPVRDPLWIALLAWSLWMCASSLWSAFPLTGAKAWLPDRWVLTPLLLWPVMLRAGLVIGAIGLGAIAQAVAVLVLSWNGAGWNVNLDLEAVSGFGQLQWQLHCAVVTASGALRFLPGPSRIASVAGLALGVFAMILTGRRLTFVSSIAGSIVAWTRPAPLLGRWAPVVAVPLLVAVAVLPALTPLGTRIVDSVRGASRSFDLDRPYVAMSLLTGRRLPLAHAAWDLGCASPWIGRGRGAFGKLLPDWARQQLSEHPERKNALAPLRSGTLNDAHNLLLGAFCEGGLPAALLLGASLFGLAVRLWRQSSWAPASSVAAAMYVAVALGMICHPINAKAPGAIVAVCMAVSWSCPTAGPARRTGS